MHSIVECVVVVPSTLNHGSGNTYLIRVLSAAHWLYHLGASFVNSYLKFLPLIQTSEDCISSTMQAAWGELNAYVDGWSTMMPTYQLSPFYVLSTHHVVSPLLPIASSHIVIGRAAGGLGTRLFRHHILEMQGLSFLTTIESLQMLLA